ncbi:MAG: DUF4910 domain-containing protein [Pseudodesulfovibrio sp.]
MMRWIEDVAPLNRVFCSDDYDAAIKYLSELLPFQVNEYFEGGHNGWEIQPHWNLVEATIRKDGKLVWDGKRHALATIALSAPFEGRVGLEELKKHLFYDNRFPEAIPYHFRQMYRPWDRDWGFCLPRTVFEGLTPGEYNVRIVTDERPGVLRVPEYTKQGTSGLTFAFVAHLDHPGMANDDLSGCIVGVELMRRLASRETKHSYKLLLVQEMIGSEYYLSWTLPGTGERVVDSLFLEMLGSKTQVSIQDCKNSDGILVNAVEQAMRGRGTDFRKGPFRTIVRNDEAIWDAYGFSMGTLSRKPYPEYHCSLDNASIIGAEMLEEAVEILLDAIDQLERTSVVEKLFTGTICLSNPAYDLYVDIGEPAFDTFISEGLVKKLRQVMDHIPGMTVPATSSHLAQMFDLDESDVLHYLRRWQAKGLLAIY